MIDKKLRLIVLGILLISILSLFLIFSFVNVSSAEISYCCEKAKSGAWCQNAPKSECDSSFAAQPTSCDATSYCRLGCCYNSDEGTCMENTPQKVCGENNGLWEANAECEVPQCELGCCLVGDQAAYVTKARCKRLSSIYGLETNFQANIGSEVECIASATSEVKGACVFEEEFEKNCRFITKRECDEIGSKKVGGFLGIGAEEIGSEFHEDYLCSASSLDTICGASKKTTCVEGRDEVFFLDTCGNLANIYDASQVDNPAYWEKVTPKAESCGAEDSNANSATCGNCDYFLGSTCKEYKRSEDKVRPNQGNYICRDLSCEYENRKYEHGETWCADAKGIEDSLPGSRHFRLVCYNGDVTVEPCADFRNEVCLQSSINGFKTAACRVNMWQDCVAQENQKDCENIDRRDCQWFEDVCLPKYAPGFNFWGEAITESSEDNKGLFSGLFGGSNKEVSQQQGQEAESICGQASTQCVVKYTKGIAGGKECEENCECLNEEWAEEMNQLCISLGDCGVKKNFIGAEGFHELEDLFEEVEAEE